jgi:hypothetical protein
MKSARQGRCLCGHTPVFRTSLEEVMVRRLLVGMITIGMLAWPALASADSAAAACSAPVATPLSSSHQDGDVLFKLGSSPKGSTLQAKGKGITFSKRLTAEGVRVQIDVPGDSVALEAAPNGTARLFRNGKTLRVRMTTAGDDTERVHRFLAGSKALLAFESLSLALEASTRPEAQSVLTSFALVHAVRGSGAPARVLANVVKTRQAARMLRASSRIGEEGPEQCWTEYSMTMNTYLTEFDTCYRNYGWVPGMNAVCAFEFVVKAELAWFWVIGCSGGVPAV